MHNIKIFTDSTSDLTKEILDLYDISVVPLYVTFEDAAYRDGIDINSIELYKKVEACNKLPKTAAPSPADFQKAFKPYIDEGKSILYIGLSSQISSTIQNAKIAAGDFPEGSIEIVDSLNLSSGIGLLVLKACDYVKEGLTVKQISGKLQEHIDKVKTAFIIDTLDYLYMGGRCTALQNFISGVLKIRPVVQVVEGKMILAQKLRGKREKSLETMLNNVLKDKENISPERIMITHSMGQEDANALKEQLEKSINAEEIIITEAGCVISSHCGPNTVGILYIQK